MPVFELSEARSQVAEVQSRVCSVCGLASVSPSVHRPRPKIHLQKSTSLGEGGSCPYHLGDPEQSTSLSESASTGNMETKVVQSERVATRI